MPIFGKIMTILNGLLAVGFLTLVVMDFGKRQQWTQAYFRTQIAFFGLPLEEEDDEWRLPEEPIAAQLSPGIEKALFRDANGGEMLGGPIVRTQQAEVERLRDKLLANVNAAETDVEKRKLFRRYLINQPHSIVERLDMSVRIEKDKIESLESELRHLFDEALKPLPQRDSTVDGKRARADKRAAIARLLVSLDARDGTKAEASEGEEKKGPPRDAGEIAWQTRVQLIVGIEAIGRALNLQAAEQTEMTSYLRTAIRNDQTTFKREYTRLVDQLPLKARIIVELEVTKADLDKLVQQHEVLVKARQEEVDDYKKRLDEARTSTKEEFARLASVEQELFTIERKLGEAEERNAFLERELRKLEQSGR